MSSIIYTPIGYVDSPIKTPRCAPIQPSGAKKTEGIIAILNEYAEGLKDLEGFSHIIVLYHFHLSKLTKLTCKPFLDDSPHGIFAIRGPNRPNAIGLSIVKLKSIQQNILKISGVDMVNGTPVLDIKPYVPEFDSHPQALTGWLTGKAEQSRTYKSDHRFL